MARTADKGRQRNKKGPSTEWILAEHLDALERNDFCDFEKPCKRGSFIEERLIPMSKARRQANRNKLVEKGGMPGRIESFREVDRRKNRRRARPGFVKSI